MTDGTATGAGKTVDGPAPAPFGLRCPACGKAGRWLRLVVEERYRLARCRTCRTQFFRPDPGLSAAAGDPVSEYWEDYKFGLYSSTAVQRDYERRYVTSLRIAERFAGPVRSVLDVGCGIGNFVAFAQRESMTAYGIDVDAAAVRSARERGLRVRRSDELDDLLPDRSVDAITLWDVIEHLYDPEPVIRPLLRKLRPDGLLLLETPDAAFPVRGAVRAAHTASGGRFDVTGHLYYWEHKIYFTETGLRSILGRFGCEVLHVRRDTSPRAKMQEIFRHYAPESWSDRIAARVWPVMETGARRLGRGNKLILVARRRAHDGAAG
jgi:SAM-dependent methyltransferase